MDKPESYIDCSECQSGGNNNGEYAHGWNLTVKGQNGCDQGTLIEKESPDE